MDLKIVVLIALLALVAWLGWQVHRRSISQRPIYGGAPAAIFNFLSGLFFVAILPTVCASVLVLHPDMVDVAGITFSPIIVILVCLGLLSLVFSVLFAFCLVCPVRAPTAGERAKRKSPARYARLD